MKGLSMLKIKEILRLKCEAKLSNRKIARALNISHSVVNEYTKEFKLINKKYEDVVSLGDKEILALFKSTRITESKYPLPDFAKVHIE
ncbi:helix-turn-helix domain-containing protein, partial [Sulfurimonas sp.]|uniref:helix-turn-helix domain-containing protein n=1 Tax=Sulfurimonas sp. TaxID=2022749 RepID=UPI0026133636